MFNSPRNYLLLVVIISILVSGAFAQEQQNLALNKAATQSSDFGGDLGYASAAIDGFTDGNFSVGSVTHTAEGPNKGTRDPWWEVDLGSVFEISKVKIYNRTDCCGERLSQFKALY
ncbi:MAG: hypothetical protein HKN33_08725, partial [Pyrinomonadaceae bacterium]|nr:hypothetical protein [Pyrinomonadaceae bacterium]